MDFLTQEFKTSLGNIARPRVQTQKTEMSLRQSPGCPFLRVSLTHSPEVPILVFLAAPAQAGQPSDNSHC